MKSRGLAMFILIAAVLCFVSASWGVPLGRRFCPIQKAAKGTGNKTYTFRFSLWDAETGGNKVWEEEKVLKTKSSVISTYLGEVNPSKG